MATFILGVPVLPSTVGAQDVQDYLVEKTETLVQTSTAAPTVVSFGFSAAVHAGNGGTLISAAVTLSAGSTNPSPQALGPDGNGGLDFNDGSITQAGLDAKFNNGIYGLIITGGAGSYSANLTLTGNTYPAPPPTITNTNWSGGALVIDPNQNFTFTWNSFSNSSPGDNVSLFDENGAFNFYFDANATSQFIPAGTLAPNTTYTFRLTFNHLVDTNTSSIPGASGSAGYQDNTGFAVRTAPAQATYEPYAINTLAGLAGAVGSNDGTGSAARFNNPSGVTVDNAGTLYVADEVNHTIRKIISGGVVSTLAGSAGAPGSADGTGSAARFHNPGGVAADSAGNVYVVDTFNSTIRKIAAGGVVSTLAGLAGANGSADGTGSAARFSNPRGGAVDSAGNVYVADFNNSTIRKITAGAVVSTLAGLAGAPGSADGTGNAARFNFPSGVAVDSAGNVYVGDSNNNTIRKITSGGVVTTLAGSAGFTGSDDGTGSAARFNHPYGVAADSAGNVYVSDSSNNTLRKITSGGVVRTLAGLAGGDGSSADGIGRAARFNGPSGVAVDSAGNVYVADTFNRTIRSGALAPPVITSPLVATGTVGLPFTYQFEASGATSLGVSNLAPGVTFDPPSLRAITGLPTTAGMFPVGLSATNSAGTTNRTLTITVQPAPTSGPVIISSTAATGRTGRAFSFQLQTSGGSSATLFTVDGLPPGFNLDPSTGFISGTPTSDGSFSLAVSAIDGTAITRATLQLTFTSDPTVPIITSAASAILTPGQPFTYTITADANGTFGYIGTDGIVHQGPSPSCAGLPAGLCFDGNHTISGTFNPPLGRDGGPRTILGLSGGIVTNVQLFATDPSGTGTFPLINFIAAKGTVQISTRLKVETGDNALIGGFIINGTGTTRTLIRAIGPSLTQFGVPNALQDPVLELHAGPLTLASNDNWKDSQEYAINHIVTPTIAPSNDLESAILAYLRPGPYTAIVRGKNNTTGVALVEVYDLDIYPQHPDNARLANISTRGFVDTGDNVIIGGFIVRPQAPATTTSVIIRAIGPSLTQFGVPNALADPTLELHNGNGTTLISNDNWQDDPVSAAQLSMNGLAPTNPLESGIATTLPVGPYTAIVRGKNNGTGVALVEVYALQ